MPTSLRFMLLGIALLLFGLAFQGPLESLILHFIPLHLVSQTMVYLLASIFPIAGLILAFIGFFMRDR